MERSRAIASAVLFVTALQGLACAGLGERSHPGLAPVTGRLLTHQLWCEPREMVLTLDPEADLEACLAGAPVGAVHLEVTPGQPPQVVAETPVGFGACAAGSIDARLVLYDHPGGGAPVELPIPAGAHCGAVLAFPEDAPDFAAYEAAAPLLPPPNATDAFWGTFERVLMPQGHH